AAVALLAVDLGGVGAAVQLEVELAGPHGRLGIVLAGTGEEGTGCGPLDLGPAVEGREGRRRGERPAGGAAAAVAPAGRGETDVAGALVLEVLLEVRELRGGELAVVRVDRREVRELGGAVDPLPLEGVVGEGRVLVPGHLLGEEGVV